MKKRYYLAYGSNINKNQMEKRCPDSEFVGISKLEGYNLFFKGYDDDVYLTINKDEKSTIPVVVWKTSENDKKILDGYEDYPNLYHKEKMNLDVMKDGGEKINLEVYVYVMNDEYKLGLPSKRYFSTCMEGYDIFSFDKEILKTALKVSENNLN